jgi:hypothetical protein
MAEAIRDLTALNRALWEFLPVLKESLSQFESIPPRKTDREP